MNTKSKVGRGFALLLVFAGVFTFAADALAQDAAGGAFSLDLVSIALLLIISGLTAALLFYVGRNSFRLERRHVLLLALGALFLRLLIAVLSPGYSSDMGCFSSWSSALAENGPGSFYTSGMFADYPPGYLYVLWFLGGVMRLFGIAASSALGSILLRLPAMLCDIGVGLLLYRVIAKHASPTRASAVFLLCALNPLAILVSAAWGQVDSVLALLLVGTFCLLNANKRPLAAFLYGLAVLVKPQALIVGPVFAIAYLLPFFKTKTERPKPLRAAGSLLLCAAIALGTIFVGSLPFKGEQSWLYIVERYAETASGYPYGSVNAFNLFGLLGFNWAPQSTYFFGLPLSAWGTIGIVLSLAAVAVFAVCSLKNGTFDYALLGACFLILVFSLGHNMHERYALPAVFLLLLACGRIADKRLKLSFALLSGAVFLNVATVLFCSFFGIYNLMGEQELAVRLFSALMLSASAYFVYVCGDICLRGRVVLEPTEDGPAVAAWGLPACAASSPARPEPFQTPEKGEKHRRFFGERPPRVSLLDPPERSYPKWGLKEKLALLFLTAVYAVVAFVNLGDTNVPQSYWLGTSGSQITVTLKEGAQPVSLWSYGGISDGSLEIAAETPSGSVSAGTAEVTYDQMFRWNITELTQSADTYVLTANGDVWINELVFVDAEGNALPVVSASVATGGAADAEAAVPLFDEQALKPEYPDPQNGMYFDELYHARTALEHLKGLTPYENSHPPLGKILIMAGIALFGMTPFGWRFSGALFGVLMLPVLYALCRRLTKKPKWAFFAAALFACDFMHFTQTRIATIDVFVVLFILLQYYFMLLYTQRSFYRDGLKNTLWPLAMSGVCFGLGAASKWTGIYAGAGLAVIFFLHLYKHLKEYRLARAEADEARIAATACFPRYALYTLLWCVLFFIAIPVGIYLLSYLPYFLCKESPYDLAGVWEVQKFMFNYHSSLTATHPYESRWYTWPFDVRPIWYFWSDLGAEVSAVYEGSILSLSCFGNPAVWLPGIAGLIALAVQRLRRRAPQNAAASFLLIGFCAQYLPWVLISRATFIYHYFPSVPFLILALAFVLSGSCGKGEGLGEEARWQKVLRVGLPVLSLALFAAFYPLIAGTPTTVAYASALKWLPSWTFYIL